MSDIKSGAHLGVAHSWIQWHARNGEIVDWGSHALLQVDLHVDDVERLAQDIRDAVLKEFHVRDSDHQYRYTIFADGGPAIQRADSFAEIWAALYHAEGRVMVKDGEQWIFTGTPVEAQRWCQAQALSATTLTPAKPQKYVVRLWDMLDGWIDISKPLSQAAAQKLWNQKTNYGKRNTKFEDGDYYAIYPANTKMLVTPEFLGR